MKRIITRPTLKRAIELVALNDEPTMTDPEEVSGMMSVVIIAGVFGKDPREIAERVVDLRRKDAGDGR